MLYGTKNIPRNNPQLFPHSIKGTFHKQPSVPENTAMDLNNVMTGWDSKTTGVWPIMSKNLLGHCSSLHFPLKKHQDLQLDLITLHVTKLSWAHKMLVKLGRGLGFNAHEWGRPQAVYCMRWSPTLQVTSASHALLRASIVTGREVRDRERANTLSYLPNLRSSSIIWFSTYKCRFSLSLSLRSSSTGSPHSSRRAPPKTCILSYCSPPYPCS